MNANKAYSEIKIQTDWIFNEIVEKMVDVFVANTVGNKVGQEGLEGLSKIFGDVHENDRADVFQSFISKLENMNYAFDITQFRDYE